jgi:molybdopterin converting factor small subunit
MMQCTIELFGVARLVAQRREVTLELPAGATVAQLFARLADDLPMLVGRVISSDRHGLLDGYACNVNGREFIRTMTTVLGAGDNVMILSADAGG